MPDTKRHGFLSRFLPASLRAAPPEDTSTRVQPALHGARRFKAARPGRLAGGFGSILGSSPRQEVRQDIRGLVSHARYAAQNVDYLKSYEMMVRRHVVGPAGIALQMEARNASGELDTMANKIVQDAWKRWGKRGNCTVDGRLSWWQVEKIAATMLAREGNFFMRKWIGPRFGPFAFQIQPISIDLLDTDLVGSVSNGGYIDGGVEFDAMNRPVAFHFWDGHPNEPHVGRQRRRLRVPAEQVIHVFRASETGQVLGVPESHTALRRFNMLAKYEEAGLTAAHYGAAAMVFFEQVGEDATPAPAPAPGEDDLPEEMEAGMMVDLPPGYTVKGNPSNYPDAAMAPFNKALIRGGATGLGVSYPGLSGDLDGVSYSGLVDGRNEERDEWRMFQRDLWEGLHDPVFQAWIGPALLSGQIALPAAKVDKFRAATWRPRGWKSANPKDDAVANDKNLANRLAAPSDIVAERGENFPDLVDRISRDMKILEAAGVPLAKAMDPAAKPDPDPVEVAVSDPDQK